MILERFGGPFEVRRPFLRLLEACENADAKVDGKKPPGDENFGSPGGMRGGPGGTIGRLIKRLKFQAYIKRHLATCGCESDTPCPDHRGRAADSNASRIPPGLYTMPGYLVCQVRVEACIVCFLSRHHVQMRGCMGDVGMTDCGDIWDKPLSKNIVAAHVSWSRINRARSSSVLRIF